MQTTRERILQIIQSQQAETVGGLARSLGLAPATVRRHLDILQRDGLVTFTEVRKGTGRPEYSFVLTEVGHETLPKEYDALLGELVRELDALPVEEIDGKSGRQVLGIALERIAHRAAEPHVGQDRASALRSLAETLQKRACAPHFEDSQEGLRIVIGNCPYRSVARTAPSICRHDVSLISKILNSPVRREACIALGDHRCAFVVAGFKLPPAGRS